jgi:hypothetical protein
MAPHHIALFYENDDALWRQCATLIRQHVQPGDAWLYIADEHSTAYVQDALGLGADNNIIPSSALHLRDPRVIVAPIVAALRERIQAMLDCGAAHALILIEMTWTIRVPSGAIYLREYEAALDTLTQQLSVTFVCIHNQRVLLDASLLESLHTHPGVCVEDEVRVNPHYVPPFIFARRDLRAQFQHWLDDLTATPTKTSTNTSWVDALPVSKRPVNEALTYSLDTPTLMIAAHTNEGRWKIHTLGNLHIYREDGSVLEWFANKGAVLKAKTLFSYLLLRGEQGATAEHLADLLWRDVD